MRTTECNGLRASANISGFLFLIGLSSCDGSSRDNGVAEDAPVPIVPSAPTETMKDVILRLGNPDYVVSGSSAYDYNYEAVLSYRSQPASTHVSYKGEVVMPAKAPQEEPSAREEYVLDPAFPRRLPVRDLSAKPFEIEPGAMLSDVIRRWGNPDRVSSKHGFGLKGNFEIVLTYFSQDARVYVSSTSMVHFVLPIPRSNGEVPPCYNDWRPKQKRRQSATDD